MPAVVTPPCQPRRPLPLRLALPPLLAEVRDERRGRKGEAEEGGRGPVVEREREPTVVERERERGRELREGERAVAGGRG